MSSKISHKNILKNLFWSYPHILTTFLRLFHNPHIVYILWINSDKSMYFMCKTITFTYFTRLLEITQKNKVIHIRLFYAALSTFYKSSYQQFVDKIRDNFYLKYFLFYINMVCKAEFRKEVICSMELIKEKWEEVKETVRREYNLTNISFSTWIAPLEVHCVMDDVVYILIPNDNANSFSYISSKYKTFFKVTISEMFNNTYDVTFILEKDISSLLNGGEPAESNPVYNINYVNANLNPKYKFDTFVVGSNNKLAHSASLAVAESPGKAYNPLYLYGGAGLGKTHLMHSIGHFILEQNSEMKVLYVNSEEFTNEVIDSIRSGNAASMTKLREKYRTVDVLMVDDIQFIIGKESTQEEFFHTFNVLHTTGKQIILSSDKPPKEMETLEERFRSRFEWGLMADIQAPDYETRMAILRKNVENCDLQIDEDIIKYIATNIKSNIRELEGAFNKIIASARLNRVNPSLSLAEEALKDIIYPDKPKEITPQLIINIVSEHFGVSPEDITSKKRNSEFVQPRQIVMYLCRTLTETSLQSISKILGKKDHTTIIHGVNKITEEINTNEELKNKIDIIRKKLNPS